MRLVFAGTPEVALPTLDALETSAHEVIAVLTRPDAPAGRGRRLHRSPVAEWADDHGRPVLTPPRPSDAGFLDQLRELAPDCVPVVAYGALVPPVALAIPRYGWLNLHFSLLPAWRGAAPVPHAILHGDELAGASVFQLEQGLDTGPIYGTVTELIRPRDTSGDLLARLSVNGAQLMVSVLDGLASGLLTPRPQPADGVSLAPKLTVEDARIRWTEPAFAVDRRIRACTPAPGAWCNLGSERLKIGPVLPIAVADARLTPGQLLVDKKQVLVGTASTPVALDQVQPAGRTAMAAIDWARGARIGIGAVLS